LTGQVAIVTGASRGIGRAIALGLAAAGADIVVGYVADRVGAESAVAEITALGRRAEPYQVDVSRSSEVDALVDFAEADFGQISIVVNNAGMETFGLLSDLDDDDWDRVLATNLSGPFYCIRRASRSLADGGSIVNISSIHSTVPRRGAAHYCAAKAGLDMLTKTAALELAARGIRVNAIAPGAILTDMNREIIEHAIGQETWKSWIPLQRVGDAAEIAQIAVFLASPAASYITGEVITADGGYGLNLVRYQEVARDRHR
jgi:NAD(P)-dependent dehydrogenase (short-subunit alcohol dehydrogenase family)